MDIASIWAFMANWSTPTILFCVLNFMIAIIFIASTYNHSSPSQLTRSPSLFERVKSLNRSPLFSNIQESHDGYYETNEHNLASQLSRPPSLLQRVKSIDFSFSSFYNSVPIDQSEQAGHSTSELTRAPSLLDRVKSFKLGHSVDTSSSQDEHINMDIHHDSVEDHKLISDSFYYNKLPNLSKKEKPTVTLKKRLPSNLSRSSSEKRDVLTDDGEEDVDLRRPATMKASLGARDESVDAKADDFIKRFKQQLKLQRIDSLQRFREMLNRGTSSS